MPCGYERTPPANITGSSKNKCPWREQVHRLLQQDQHTHWNFQPLPVPPEMDSAEQEGCGAAQDKQAKTDGNTDGRQVKKQLTVLVGSFIPEPLYQARLVVHSSWVAGS